MKKRLLFLIISTTTVVATIQAQTWNKVSDASMGSNLRGILVNSGNLYSTTSSAGIASSSNGTSWSTSATGLTAVGKQTKRLGADNSFIYTGTPDGVYRSNDNGVTWTNTDVSLNSNANNYGNYFGYFGSTTFCVMSTYQSNGGGLFRSTDNGTTWTQSQTGIPTNELLTNIIELGSDLFIGSSLGMFKSSDNGLNWTSVTVPASAQFSGLYNHNGRLLAMSSHPSGGILYSDDNGASWQSTTGGPTGFTAGKIIVGANDTLYSMAPTKGVYYSSDNGLNWTDMTGNLAGLDLLSMADMVYFNGYLYIATFSGVMSNQPGATAIDELTFNTDISIYPNPFNDRLSIENKDGLHLNISLINISGQTVLSADGNDSKITLNTENLPKGLYIMRTKDVITGELIDTGKVIKL